MFIPPSVGGRGVGVGGSGQCTIVWGGKLFISTQFSVAESVFCLSFKFWLNFRFFKIHGFDLIIFFCFSLGKTLKLIHKLAWTVGCQNPKFQNFAQSILASTTFLPKHHQNRKKVVTKSNLKCHLLTNTGGNLHTCNTCGKSFGQNSHLTEHLG